MRSGFTLSVFFFQAEDGIRDSSVTGVQTCALPISRGFLRVSLGQFFGQSVERGADRLHFANQELSGPFGFLSVRIIDGLGGLSGERVAGAHEVTPRLGLTDRHSLCVLLGSETDIRENRLHPFVRL